MKATALNQVAQVMPLALIEPSAFNPRKEFSESELKELSDSIRQKGVLQPILLRPKGDRFEIVYGERRYRASALAQLTEIPANVRELTDADAREISITENLQRSDIAPLEEATAFKTLMQFTGCEIAELVTRFGKSEQYIRGRIRLNQLIPQLAELLTQRLISLAAAIELSRYSEEVQKRIYEDHFQEEDGYSSWREMTLKNLTSNIDRHYTNDLKNFHFEKTDCLDCVFNSSCNSLFPEPDKLGKCSNSTCLNQKNIDYLLAYALKMASEIPNIRFCYSYQKDEDLIGKLIEHGFEVKQTYDPNTYPSEPLKPTFKKGMSQADKTKVTQEYKARVERYKTGLEKLVTRLEEGRLIQYGRIEANRIVLCYLEVEKPLDVTPDSEIVRLEAKDKRNKEIAREKIVDDAKALFRKASLGGMFSEIEEKALYFLMLSTLRNGNFKAIGVKAKSYLETNDKIKIVENLTEDMKTIIRRDFLVRHLPDVLGSAQELLINVTKQHTPDEMAVVEKNHLEVYNKRNSRIKERINVLKASMGSQSSKKKTH